MPICGAIFLKSSSSNWPRARHRSTLELAITGYSMSVAMDLESIATDIEYPVIASSRVLLCRARGQFDELLLRKIAPQIGIQLIAYVGRSISHRVCHTQQNRF